MNSILSYPRAAITADAFNPMCDGNSLVYGEGAANRATHSWPALVAAGLGIAFPNNGVGGRSIQVMRTNAPTVIDANLHATKRNLLLPYEWTNEVSTNGRNAAAAHAQWVLYCNERRAAAAAAGKKLTIVTMTALPAAAGADASITNARMAAMLEVVRLARENWRSYSDYLFDLAAHEPFRTLYANGDWSHAAFDNTGMYNRFTGGDGVANDRVHLGNAGYARMAEIILQQLKRIRRT